VDCDFKLLEWVNKEETPGLGPGMGMIIFSVFKE
jgi:hypothetical protein